MSDVYVNIGDTVHISDPSVDTSGAVVVVPETVTSLLQQSREAHARFHEASGAINVDGTPRKSADEFAQIVAIQSARDARAAAQQMDPQHSDPAWAADEAANRGVTSAALMTFYDEFLHD